MTSLQKEAKVILDKDEKAKKLMDSLGLDPEQKAMAEKSYQHSKDCRLCKMVVMCLGQIIILHMEEHEESLR